MRTKVKIFSGAGSWNTGESDRASSRASEVDNQVNGAIDTWFEQNPTYTVTKSSFQSRLEVEEGGSKMCAYFVTVLVEYQDTK